MLDAADTALEAALEKNPVNHGTFAPSRTKVATVSPGATLNVWPRAITFPESVTSSMTYDPPSTPSNVNCPVEFATIVASILPVTTLRSRRFAFGTG